MQILVISDTHGDIARAYELIKKMKATTPPDLILHCGDYYKDGIEIENRTGIPVTWVKGNCDGAFSEKEYAIVETEYGNLLVTHGHMDNVDFSQQNLFYKAQELECCAAIYGHTHRAAFAQTGGIYLLNPGSLTRPRDGSGGTFGLITTAPDYFWGRIQSYEAFMAAEEGDSGGGRGGGQSGQRGQGRGTKVQGGYLRGLLNYSDRF